MGEVSWAEVTGIQMLVLDEPVGIKLVFKVAGQFVTSGAHEVMVATWVLNKVTVTGTWT
jgi:hypothetical protein